MFWFDFAWDIQHFLNQFWWQINFVLLVILVVLGYLGYKKPAYAAGGLIILLPTYLFRSKILFLPFTFLELALIVVFISWLVSKIQNGELRNLGAAIQRYRLPITLILLASTVSFIISPDRTAAAGLWKAYFIEPLLFFVMIANILKSPEDKKTILWALGISTLSISLFAISQKFTGFGIFEPSWTGPENRRVTAMFSSPNAVGLFLGPITALYIGWILEEWKKLMPTVLKTIVVILNLIAIWFTVSHGTMIGLAAAIAFLLFFGWNKIWTSALVIIGGVIALFIPKAQALITFSDAAGQNRLMLWELALQHLIVSPINFIFGAGILGYAKIQDAVRDPLIIEPLLYPHNIFLNFWTEIGLLGLIAFVLVFVSTYIKGLKKASPSWLTLGALAAVTAIAVHGLIDVPYFKNDLAILFWIFIALV